MDKFSITQSGTQLDKSQYRIDLEKKVFTSKANYLVLDFGNFSGWTFKTGDWCTFHTGGYCTFKTGYGCIFDTGSGCTFDTYDNCTFKTGTDCTFVTYHHCTFKTGNNCTFKTGMQCTFSLWDINSCTFKTGDGYSIILDRRDNESYKLTKEFLALQKVKNG